MDNRYDDKIAEMKERLETLLMAPKFVITNVVPKRGNHKTPGVYVISTPDDSEIVYAGKTTDLNQRMKDHRLNEKEAELNVKLKKFTKYPPNCNEYVVRYIEVIKERDRIILEHFLTAVLNPPFND